MLGASGFLPFFLPFFLSFLSFLPLSLFLPMTVPPALSITIQDTSRFSRGHSRCPRRSLNHPASLRFTDGAHTKSRRYVPAKQSPAEPGFATFLGSAWLPSLCAEPIIDLFACLVLRDAITLLEFAF